ncbi:MAG: universal stress protein [Pseudomonadota bacterium]
MGFKTIACFIDASPDSQARLDYACRAAGAWGAHLVAVALSRQPDVGVYAVPGGEMAVDLARIDETRAEAKAMADAACGRIEAKGLSPDARWAANSGPGLEDAVARAGRHADLCITGPTGGGDADLAESTLDGALFGSGRPVLVVPRGWTGESVAKRIMVAWDGSLVAARAVGCATPLLAAAEHVSVAIVDPDPDDGRVGEEPGADIAAVIARHGADTSVDQIPSSGASVAERLMARAAVTGTDLIVMGGYGHSRLREALFSGVSRQVFENPAVPVLAAH